MMETVKYNKLLAHCSLLFVYFFFFFSSFCIVQRSKNIIAQFIFMLLLCNRKCYHDFSTGHTKVSNKDNNDQKGSRRELKHPDEIFKQRKLKARKEAFQKQRQKQKQSRRNFKTQKSKKKRWETMIYCYFVISLKSLGYVQQCCFHYILEWSAACLMMQLGLAFS